MIKKCRGMLLILNIGNMLEVVMFNHTIFSLLEVTYKMSGHHAIEQPIVTITDFVYCKKRERKWDLV